MEHDRHILAAAFFALLLLPVLVLTSCGGGGGGGSAPASSSAPSGNPASPDSPQPSSSGSAPSAPTGVTAVAGAERAIIYWDAAPGATSYNIYWSTRSGVTPSNGTKVSKASSPCTMTALTAGLTYYCVVTAINSYGESSPSSQVEVTPGGQIPSAPTGLSAMAGNSQVSLGWTASPGASSYNIYRGTSSGALSQKKKIVPGITATSYTDTTASNGTTYYYQVTAVSAAGESQGSNEVSATPSAPALAKTVCGAQGLASNQMPVCFGSSYWNEAYVTVFIVNSAGVPTPFNLILDTGATGILVNQSSLQAAGVGVTQTNETFSGQFGDGSKFGGYVSSATISTLPSGGLVAANFPIAVNQVNCDDFPVGSFLDGDFGMGLSGVFTFGMSYKTPSLVSGLPTGYTDGFLLQFQANMNSDGYGISGSGLITFGLDTAGNNGTSGYSFFPNDISQSGWAVPNLDAGFGKTTSVSGSQYRAFFDTGSNFIYMDENAMENATGVALINGSTYEYDGGLVKGGLFMNMGLYNGTGYDGRAAFTTCPNDATLNPSYEFPFLSIAEPNGYLLLKNAIYDINILDIGQEDIGLPYFFNFPVYFASPSSGRGWGVGIKFH